VVVTCLFKIVFLESILYFILLVNTDKENLEKNKEMERVCKMSVLFIHSDKIILSDIPWGLLELGMDVEIYDKNITIQSNIQEEEKMLSQHLEKKKYEFVISHNYSPTISNACKTQGVIYVSWIFDSPLMELYEKSAYNSNNYIFVFDKAQYERMKKRGLQHLYHLPLAANVSRASTIAVEEEDVKKYSCDISFIGGLYRDNSYNLDIHRFSSSIKEYLDKIIMENAFQWGKASSIFGSVTKEIFKDMSETLYLYYPLSEAPEYTVEVLYIVRKIAEIERICILNALALNHHVCLYTGSSCENLENVIVHPPVSYDGEAPKIFHLSKINLNITLHSIETGIPQRVFDIMSVGGFVMSNYQEELAERFVPDVEIVMFKNMEDLVRKVNYYLKHEEERLRIAMNGYKKVRDYYSYPKALSKIIEIVRGEEEGL
jgi:spore maturation protein CgeB